MTNARMSEEEESRYAEARLALGSERFEALRRAKILVVGAGGIGCELLKNLVLLGVETLTAVDLDTIDVSNLNRQFLFRKKHVGQSKAEVAKLACEGFNPKATIEAYRANVKEGRFGVGWFATFDVVINALDNADARRHVNRTCLAANVPLVEAGTTGYLGQVFSVMKGATACYECFPKPQRKVYPVCTIRSTPDKPVHCVVWAKELLKLAFGDAKESMLNDDDDDDSNDDAPAQGEEEAKEDRAPIDKAVFAEAVASLRTTENAAADAAAALFHLEIEKQIALHKEKEQSGGADDRRVALDATRLREAIRTLEPPSTARATTDWDRKAWSVEESAAEFAKACEALRLRGATNVAFDKDDDDAMAFVVAAANLRSANFQIPPQSLHDAKGVAGNIIPAIATTNAIVAGLQVSQLVKIITLKMQDKLASDFREVCKYVNVPRSANSYGSYVTCSTLDEPQPTCYVCRSAVVDVGVDLKKTTLRRFVDAVLVDHFGFAEPAIDVGDSGVYDPDDSRLDANKALPLADIPNVRDGALLKATDYATDLELTVVLHNKVGLDPDEFPNGFKLLKANDDEPDGDDDKRNNNNNKKRPRDDEDVVVILDDPSEKKSKKTK